MDDLLAHLTSAQREAAEHREGPLLILAGPGSGKTRVVTHRIANLLRSGVPGWQILALTFTNKAAGEMRERVEALAPGSDVWTSTFHRFCAKLLRKYASHVGLPENYTIYDTADAGKALRNTLEDLQLDESRFTPDQVAHAISWAKNNLISAEEYEPRPGHPLGKIVAVVYPAYQQKLLTSGAVDFDDLLLHVARMLRDNAELRATLDERFRYIMVDEYQDTNLAQYAIVRAMSIDHPNLAVTGDPDQSIYGWRGANLSNILDFERDYPDVHVVRLEQNYRSTKSILRVAAALISHNRRRKEKALFTENDEGSLVRFTTYPTQREEALAIASEIADQVRAGHRRPRDFAIFYRMNALSRSLELALHEMHVPYQMVNGLEFYKRQEIKDVLAYLQLLNNPRDEIAFTRMVNTPPRGIGKSTIARLREHAERRGIPLLEAARESGLVEGLPKRAAVAVARFVAMFDRFALLAQGPVSRLITSVLAESGYRTKLEESDSEEDQERLANVEELLTAAHEFDENYHGENRLETFLEDASLVNETDAWEVSDDRVTLMTLHASKGLEFPVVFLLAVEQGLIPHERSQEHPDQLEEERRLLFVGMTRAQEELWLSRAEFRDFRGQRRMSIPSSFLLEIPQDALEFAGATRSELLAPPPASKLGSDRASLLATMAARGTGIRLTTAAQLAGGEMGEGPRHDPLAFEPGMLVCHPVYGLGTIVDLSGQGRHRRAVVEFVPDVGRRNFVLVNSDLQPVKSGGSS
ncbi:MAG: UvrD-helicase domain-containing protein [Pirellulales bacterium]|nr:UvrD-helicase domain-containing protein [Pirellulales bacterium]